MNVIKRDGSEVIFTREKIINAITKANNELPSSKQLNKTSIQQIAYEVERQCQTYNRAVSVEEIQDMVEKELLKVGTYDLTKNYMIYRYQHNVNRQDNALDSKILSLVELENEEIKQENSNKNPILVSTQRDYMAGEMSKDLTRRKLLPADIMDAHDKGIIHFHDTDYFAQHMYNCCLINLEDMLQNGTVISNTYIEKPKSFTTACNVATQIMAQVASSQYGGQSITLSHLAPFVDVSRQKIKKVVAAEVDTMLKNVTLSSLFDSEKVINEITEQRVLEEIKKGVQTIQYQINTLQTTNGQTPFCTIFLYINEVPEGQTRSDLTLIIEEVLKQRMQGVKNEKGVWITPAFPKLIYVLQENNISEKSEYFYLTKLAAKCSAKRLVPDYISEKVMYQLKGGHCFPSMGCRSFLSPWAEDPDKYYGRLTTTLC